MSHSSVLPAQSRLTPVPLDSFRWPGGIDKAVVILRAEPPELASRYGIAFTRDVDDLDWHQVAIVQLPSGRPVMFIRYEGSPGPGTEVAVDHNDSLDAAWEELRAVLGIDDSATSWRSEFMGQPRDAA